MAAKAINVSGEDMEAPRFDTTTEDESYVVTEGPKAMAEQETTEQLVN